MADMYKFRIKGIRLISARFDLKTDKKYKPAKDIPVSTTLELKYDFIDDKKLLQLFMKFDAYGETSPLSLTIEMVGDFIFSGIIKIEQTLDKIARINCAAILFPYLRETVGDIVRRSGLPPFSLPPVNFVALYKTKPSEKTKKLK